MRPGDIYIARRGNRIMRVILRNREPAGRWAATEVGTRIRWILRPGELCRKAILYDLAEIASR